MDLEEETEKAMQIAKNIAEEFNRKKIPLHIAMAALEGLLTSMAYTLGWSKYMYLESVMKVADVQWEKDNKS